MFRTSFLFLFSALFFYPTIGEGENKGISEIIADFNKSNSRMDAEQDPFTSVTLAAQAGDPQSKLFSTCTAKSRTFEAKFASIEVGPGSEYIRYVPVSSHSSSPISWKSVNGNYSNIFDCAQAVHDASWSMFKYNGAQCEATNMIYDLNDVPKCEEENSDAVFILSSVTPTCPVPQFFVGNDENGTAICGLVSEVLMTHDEAKNFCLNAYPNQKLCLFLNEHPPLTLQNATIKFTELGYNKTNLWVDAKQRSNLLDDDWHGNFAASDWWDGRFPAVRDAGSPFRVAYLDRDSNFKMRVSDPSFKAGVLCITYAIPSSPDYYLY